MRTSTCMPLRNLKLTLLSPLASTSTMPGKRRTSSISAARCSSSTQHGAGDQHVEIADRFAAPPQAIRQA